LLRGDRKTLRDLAASEEVFRQAPSTLHLLGLHLGDNEDGLALLRKAQQSYPSDFWINFQLGNCCSEMKRPQRDAALLFYRVAVWLRPQSSAAHNNLGAALADQKKLEEAVAAFRKAIELQPDDATAYSNLGSLLCDDLHRPAEAETAFRKAI